MSHVYSPVLHMPDVGICTCMCACGRLSREYRGAHGRDLWPDCQLMLWRVQMIVSTQCMELIVVGA